MIKVVIQRGNKFKICRRGQLLCEGFLCTYAGERSEDANEAPSSSALSSNGSIRAFLRHWIATISLGSNVGFSRSARSLWLNTGCKLLKVLHVIGLRLYFV